MDLVFSTTDFTVIQAPFPLVPADAHHPPLSFSLNNITGPRTTQINGNNNFRVEKRFNFKKGDYPASYNNLLSFNFNTLLQCGSLDQTIRLLDDHLSS